MTANQILSEKKLADWLNLPLTDAGVSRNLTYWISKGLRYVELSKQRYFFDDDIVAFFEKMAKTEQPEKLDPS